MLKAICRRIQFLSILLILTAFYSALSAAPPVGPEYSGPYDVIGNYRVYRMQTNTDNSCGVYYMTIPVDPMYSVRDPTIALYQASSSITFEPGFATAPGDAFVAQIVPPTFGVPPATNLTGTPDVTINWVQETTFDENGAVIGDNKQFYDSRGQELQTQNKVFYHAGAGVTYTHVLASQPILDAYGRDAATTLPAPIDFADFSYRANFLQHNASGAVYNHQNFDLYNNGTSPSDNTISPQTLWDATTGNPVQGTLAWYYSTQNTWEPYTPVTGYPYLRQTYYQDGTGNTKKNAASGEQLRMGSTHELSTYVTPVADELDFYVAVRNKFFPATQVGALPGNLIGQAVQTVSRDENGLETETITDRSGKTLMTARTGAGISVNNTATISAAGPGNMNIYYFKLLASGVVGITGSFGLYDMMNTELAVPSFSSGGTLPAGYYKVINTGTTPLTLTYSNSYADVSYNFYDQKGALVASIAPAGVNLLYGTNGSGLTNYAASGPVPYMSQYTYDVLGRVVIGSEPDRGLVKYIYRNDGKLRFSQNAVQALAGAYSYINYDAEGRLIETGQYDGSGLSFINIVTAGILETTAPGGGLTTGTKTDAVMTQYDVADNSYSTNTGNNVVFNNYKQDAFNLAGVISVTKRYSSVANNSPMSTNLVSATWFNYDEEGKTVWEIKYIKGLGVDITDVASYKTINYAYDVLANLVQKTFQSGQPDAFTQLYTYDPVNQQLLTVSTTTATNPTPMLQATYYYYLHGGVKRVELAGNLQGIDYTYTLQTALKSINNGNKMQDPGGDGSVNNFGADAFGEVLDYFSGDYTNGRTGTAAIAGVNAPAPTTDSYAGNIKAMSWYSEKPTVLTSAGVTDAPTAYVYQYDPKYQFTAGAWGSVAFSNTTTPATFTPTNTFSETVGNGTTVPYDGNGNIQYLQRTGNTAGQVTDALSYQYGKGNNQLTGVTNTLTNLPYSSYTYDANGQMTGEVVGSNTLSLVYDVTGKVTTVYQGTGTTLAAAFVYDETGKRIKKLTYSTSGVLMQVTFYVGDAIYTQGVMNGTAFGPVTVEQYQIRGMDRIGGYFPNTSPPMYAYELKDHLGNVRAVIAATAGTTAYTVQSSSDYYPYGGVINAGGTYYRYGYQGQNSEKDPETQWNAFGLRMYDSKIGRWLQYDPQGQFYSPYVGMGNNPVKNTDPDGGETNSTHIDQNGVVLAVYNDQDLGVYEHDDLLASKYDGHHLSKAGAKFVGVTPDWDEFADHYPNGQVFQRPMPGAKIHLNINIDNMMDEYHQLAVDEIGSKGLKAGATWLYKNSANGADLDIKQTVLGAAEGYVYKNFIISGESAGDFLFGANLRLLYPHTIFLNDNNFENVLAVYDAAMQVVGAYNISQNKLHITPQPPYWGEDIYAGRMQARGFFGSQYGDFRDLWQVFKKIPVE
jgi:RHS repeat-associated protein